MILAVDVQYDGDDRACAAAVAFHAWPDEASAHEAVVHVHDVEPYVPGQFYRRELPCILALLETLDTRPDTIVVDGYVDVGPDRPGLGRHLFDALGGGAVVVGVAKTLFVGAEATEVYRGQSTKPLFVTSAGVDAQRAAALVGCMAGPHRLPALLQPVDHLARGR